MTNRKAADSIVKEWISEGEINIESGSVGVLSIKKVIYGRAYNVKTAISRALYFDEKCPDYEFVEEELFQTRNGAYFIVGHGQAYSPWAYKLRDCDDRAHGHGLLPVSEGQVKKWLEVRELTEEYEEIFGTPDSHFDQSKGKECSIILRLPCAVTDKLARIADAKNCSRQQLLKKMVEEYLNVPEQTL